jgi:hypothetical protein
MSYDVKYIGYVELDIADILFWFITALLFGKWW